ncbi:MAG: SDR family NAD(P)-dependent oxidoreductase [Pseudomonadota bacterium]
MTDQIPLEVPWGRKPEPDTVMGDADLSGKRVVLTGGYSGIGLEATKAFVSRGASVIIPARSKEKAEAALADVPNTTIGTLDLADVSSAKAFADSIMADGKPVDLLINNAGVMASPLSRIGNNWEGQFAVNHLGHFVLTQGLMPALLKATKPRVVALSSLAHRITPIIWDDVHFESSDYQKWVAYGQSKTANALFARHLTKLHDSLEAFSVHPGGIMTDLQRHLTLEEQVERGWLAEDGSMPDAIKAFFKTPAQGTATTLWAAVSTMLDGKGGVYCEDCNIAAPAPDDDKGIFGVRRWACSDEDAERLWSVTEAMLAG